MDVIYTDKNRNDVGVLRDFSLDVDLAKGKDFEIKTGTDNQVLTIGSYWYIDGTEYGGHVDRIKVDTDSDEITWGGRSWRGMLDTKVVSPPAGKAYRYLDGEWQDEVQGLLTEYGLDALFTVEAIDLTLDRWKVDRYCTLLDALLKILDSKRHRLILTWADGKVRIGAMPIRDLTDTVQYETDDRVGLIVEDNRGGVNHLICIGQGELENREVVHLYCTATGGITELQQTYTGLDEIVEVYENTSAATREELKSGGFDRLKERRNSQTFSVSVEDIDVQIGDIVGGKESVTGIKVAEPVTNIIFKLDYEGVPSIEYKVGNNT